MTFWNPAAAAPNGVLDGVALRIAGRALRRTTFREGYSIADVDGFLERAAVALDELNRHAMPSLTAEAVLAEKFKATKFREGYDQDEVDDLLDRVVASLKA